MNKSIITLLLLGLTLTTSAQIWEDQLRETNPNPSIKEKNDAFEKYRSEHAYTKGNGFKPYAREMDFSNERSTEDSPFQPNALFIEWKKEQEKYENTKTTSASNWIAKGPINTPIILSNGKKRGNGRVNCIAFDPIDANIIWIGSPSGGLWKSIDGGSNWTTATDNLPVIGVSSIAIDPTNSQNMLIVTGDANADDTYSIGILKSTDGGVNWNTTSLSYTVNQEKTINKVIINPNYPDSAYAATNSNIMISTDGGANWSTTGSIGRWRDIEFKPGTPSTVYAAKQTSGGSNVYRTTDGGANWSLINNGVATGGKYRPLIAVTPANPDVIYALYSSSNYGFHGLYKSSNSGDTWALQSNTPNILGRETSGNGVGGQSWYDLSLGLSTNDENHIYVGGINIWESTNGGQNWNINASSGNGTNYTYMHVDQHAFEFNPLNHIAYAGNDGGFYKYMDNLNKWVDISDGLEISQFYRLGVSQSNPNRVVAGAQDNGTEMLTNSTWDAIMGGDGMECMIDHYDEDVIFAEYQYGGMRRSFNGGANWDYIKPVSYDGAWVTPFKMHATNNYLIVAGYDEVYRSLNGGDTWDSISYNVSNGQSLRTIALAPSDEDYIYAATYSKLKVTKDGGATWTNIKSGLPNINITDVTVSSINPDRVWVTLSGYTAAHKVYESIDGGSNWTNITGNNLPNLPVNCIIYQDEANEDLYIGTDIGVYHKDKNMTSWMPYMNGLPNVIVKELEIQYGEGTLSAATYGRGVWETTINMIPAATNTSLIKHFNIYPNPAKDRITINTNHSVNNNLGLTVYSITGQTVISAQISSSNSNIDISNLSKGCYIVELDSENGFTAREKLIIE